MAQHTPGSTVAAWLNEHRPLTTYARLREDGQHLTTPGSALDEINPLGPNGGQRFG